MPQNKRRRMRERRFRALIERNKKVAEVRQRLLEAAGVIPRERLVTVDSSGGCWTNTMMSLGLSLHCASPRTSFILSGMNGV